MKQRIFNIQQNYRIGINRLIEAGIADAVVDAWLLMEYVTGITKEQYIMDPCYYLPVEEEVAYFSCIEKRARHIPLQHITGSQEFMGYPFAVNEHVLIPRQDTEVLVEEGLQYVKQGDRILDMCTGSGCILLSLMKYAAERNQISGLLGVGTDISADALLVAEKNRQALLADADVTLVQSDLFANVEGTFDLILSNPPYIKTDVIDELSDEVKLHDPRIALDGDADGLHFYRRIVKESVPFIKRGGRLLFEIGHDQGADVSLLMKEAGFADVQVKKDLAGLDRVVFGRYNENN